MLVKYDIKLCKFDFRILDWQEFDHVVCDVLFKHCNSGVMMLSLTAGTCDSACRPW